MISFPLMIFAGIVGALNYDSLWPWISLSIIGLAGTCYLYRKLLVN